MFLATYSVYIKFIQLSTNKTALETKCTGNSARREAETACGANIFPSMAQAATLPKRRYQGGRGCLN